jgi:hypothetical protein
MTPAQVAARVVELGITRPTRSRKPSKKAVLRAKKVLAFLEDRRVLFNDSELEMPDHCTDSVFQIRQFLTDLLPELPDALAAHIGAMLAACRDFLDSDPRWRVTMNSGMSFGVFAQRLGRLRAEVGLRVAIIATMHGLGVGSALASILPSPTVPVSGA